MALEDLYGRVLAYSAYSIREQTALPMLVNTDTTGLRSDAVMRNGVTHVIVPPEFTARDVIPGPVPPASGAVPNPGMVPVTLSNHKEVNFPLTATHIALIESSSEAVPMFLRQAVAPIVELISDSIASLYRSVYNAVGTPGTPLFTVSPQAAQQAKTLLTRSRCPRYGRHLVLSSDAYGHATGLESFRSVIHSGSPEALREGEISRGYGFDWHEDLAIDSNNHVAGTAAGYLVNRSAPVAGNTTIVVDTGTGTFVVGDIFTVAGDAQQYVVTAAYAGGAGTISFSPAARVAWADNAAITRMASHNVALAFHPYAFAFDSRPEASVSIAGVKSNFMTFVDEITGVALRLEIREEYHQLGFYMSCLWGSAFVDARLACRLVS
jgi:P22 coat protein - gene protein 5